MSLAADIPLNLLQKILGKNVLRISVIHNVLIFFKALCDFIIYDLGTLVYVENVWKHYLHIAKARKAVLPAVRASGQSIFPLAKPRETRYNSGK